MLIYSFECLIIIIIIPTVWGVCSPIPGGRGQIPQSVE